MHPKIHRTFFVSSKNLITYKKEKPWYTQKMTPFLTHLIYNVLHVCPLRPKNMNDKIEIVTNTNSEDHEVHEGHKNHVIFGIFLDFRFSFCIKSSV